MTLPKLTIAAKLYAIFAAMATVTVVLAVIAIFNARQHTQLTHEFEAANSGAWHVERVNGLIYAVVMESRGIYMSDDVAQAKVYADGIRAFNAEIATTMAAWKNTILPQDMRQFDEFSGRIDRFIRFRNELARLGTEVSPAAARAWGDNDANRNLRKALNQDIGELAELYKQRTTGAYRRIGTSIDDTAFWLLVLGVLAVVLAVVGTVLMARNVVKPLSALRLVTESVAAGRSDVVVTLTDRHDEIGALARAIGVFQEAMRHNAELNQTIVHNAETRSRRQEVMANEISRFSAEVEATVSELGRISDQMLAASSQLALAADNASSKTKRAEQASAEASTNVRDIASAADQLSASVNEIDRQVAQSNAIASKAVSEAEQTNITVKELDEAAARIGDVVKLITDIAEQTNLLALNATIEAARAGEAGRGFAVVASEVKALAGQTSRATEEIGAQIAGMQRATLRSIAAIGAIEQTIRQIGDISGAIAAAVTEQGAATQEIARSVEIAARRTAETANEVNLVGGATADTRTSAVSVKSVADDLGSVAGRIRAQVDQFFDRLSA